MQGARALLPFGLTLLSASVLALLASTFATSVALAPIVAYAVAFAFVSLELLAAAHFVPAPSSRVALGTVLLGAAGLATVRHWGPGPGSAALLTLSLLAGGAVVGSGIGSRIEKPGHLVAVFAISALADLWSVYDPSGPSAKLAQQAAAHPGALVLFALPWPMLGTSHIEAFIGAGDIVFAALYSAALRRHGLRAGAAAVGMGLALLAGLALLITFERALPLLPLMGAAVMLTEPEARRLPQQDRRSVVMVVTVLSLLLIYRFAR